MSTYSELIKNFNKVRSYMRDFYVYGFKTRDEYDKKSRRSYDDERRRIKSYLGDLVQFKRTSSGNNVFISLDGRTLTHNPLYKAFKSKTFTANDITFHFIILDILKDGEAHDLDEIIQMINDYLGAEFIAGTTSRISWNGCKQEGAPEYKPIFDYPRLIDEGYEYNSVVINKSTLYRKLEEYVSLGIINKERNKKTVRYRLAQDKIDLEQYREAIRFYTEEDILGVVGSYLEDKVGSGEEFLRFKNHFILGALDAEILETVLQGIHERRQLEITKCSRVGQEEKYQVTPLKLYIGLQDGRNYLICIEATTDKLYAFRIDYINEAVLKREALNFDDLMERYEKLAQHMWGVSCFEDKKPDHFEMDIHVGQDEDYILRRLYREKRCGKITQIDDETWRFSADLFDTNELLPWVQTFYGRIIDIRCEDTTVMDALKRNLAEMAEQYEVTA